MAQHAATSGRGYPKRYTPYPKLNIGQAGEALADDFRYPAGRVPGGGATVRPLQAQRFGGSRLVAIRLEEAERRNRA